MYRYAVIRGKITLGYIETLNYLAGTHIVIPEPYLLNRRRRKTITFDLVINDQGFLSIDTNRKSKRQVRILIKVLGPLLLR